ncbi:regulator of chromosome condensation [Anaeramoeba flamelloides]|uniref:Regulator of chromosome condensation n=1 Tax=Anaeramoeba flamelloides TaxID=1746091 RepID=A0AAV7YC97_9EUKA|nr:regulator of chromosome condensation [Anaeramoeba flamelloides]KAJ6228174.1 regulator of chromosome condensation [Anaeramoeba flamelloides]
MSRVYYFDQNSLKRAQIQEFEPITQIKIPKKYGKIVGLTGGSIHAIHLYEGGECVLYDQSQVYETKFENEDEKVLKFTSGYHHSMILTNYYNVYAASVNQSGQCAILNRGELRPPAKVTYFEKRDLVVHDVICGVTNTFFLCRKKNKSQEMQEDGYQLYSCGFKTRNGNGTDKDLHVPTYVTKNVEQLFTGNYSYHFFIIKTNGDLFGSGEGKNGKLGNKKTDLQLSLVPINLPLELTTDDILEMQNGYYHSVLLTKNGEIWTCGKSRSTGLESDVYEFTRFTKLSNHFITKISIGRTINFVITSKNEVFCWGSYMSTTDSTEPKKIELPDLEEFSGVEIVNTSLYPFIYESVRNGFVIDFLNLLASENFTDIEIHEQKAHKAILQCRIGLRVDSIKQTFEEHFTKEEFERVLQWAYGEKRFGFELNQKMKQYFHIQNCNSKRLINDISELYNDEESKDFLIKIKDFEEEDEDEKDEDEDEDEAFEEIPVHKCVLFARSGLYREMFKNVQTETNEVQDYSNKTLESLEIITKYFYTGNIHLTADDDPKLILEELQDASDYYQLTDPLRLNGLLKKMKLQYKL